MTVDVCGGHDLLAEGFQISRRAVYHGNGREGLVVPEPVVYSGVDLFGWPSGEVVDCFRRDGLTVEAFPQVVRVGPDLVLFRWSQAAESDAVVFDTAMLTSVRLPQEHRRQAPAVTGGPPA